MIINAMINDVNRKDQIEKLADFLLKEVPLNISFLKSVVLLMQL